MSGVDRKVREVDTLQGKKKRAQTELTSPSYEQNTKVDSPGILRNLGCLTPLIFLKALYRVQYIGGGGSQGVLR